MLTGKDYVTLIAYCIRLTVCNKLTFMKTIAQYHWQVTAIAQPLLCGEGRFHFLPEMLSI